MTALVVIDMCCTAQHGHPAGGAFQRAKELQNRALLLTSRAANLTGATAKNDNQQINGFC
jgi:hypothetical protein